jgi:hypothetical protein
LKGVDVREEVERNIPGGERWVAFDCWLMIEAFEEGGT